MSGMTQYPGHGTATRDTCLEWLATGLSRYPDLAVTVRVDGPAPHLAVRNTAVPYMSETVTVSPSADGLAYMWSWGVPICDASDSDGAAHAVAYVLGARGARPGR